jgi:hypothetical protein
VASTICKAGRARAQRSAHRFVDTSCAPLIKKYKDDNEGLVYKVNMINIYNLLKNDVHLLDHSKNGLIIMKFVSYLQVDLKPVRK